ncbi:MAG: inositol monophosphatase [Bacteroidales bacterium]|nr:inositol monophosphatase [Bacteroidales bacterium]
MDLKQLSLDTIEVSKAVGQFLKTSVSKLSDDMIHVKASMDFVTEIDKQSEVMLVDELSRLLPEAGFIAEEGTSTKKGEHYNWIIDPLDGTTNFIHGVIPFCISIALMRDHDLVIGIIYDPIQQECFYAWENGGAFLNDTAIQVSTNKSLDQSLVATGFPYTDFSLIDEYMSSLREFMGKTHGVRRLGSAAMDLAYVACGRYDAFYEYHLKPWDVAAGTVIIREAGGSVCDFKGGDDYLFGENYVATNSFIRQEFMEVIMRHFMHK